jgi:hypothetical protein
MGARAFFRRLFRRRKKVLPAPQPGAVANNWGRNVRGKPYAMEVR